MRVFLDTNVLVSAFTTRGLCADVFRHVLADHELASGQAVIDELQRVLRDKFRLADEMATAIVELVRSQAHFGIPDALADIRIRDPDDLLILSAALASGAQILVTGDNDLLDLAPMAAIRILSPRAYWEAIKA